MTIRPIDLQVLMPRVQEVGKNQQLQNQQEQMAQQQFAAELKHQTEKRSHQVRDSEKSEGQVIKEHEQKKDSSGDTAKRRGGAEEEQQEEEQPKDPLRGNILDIKV